MSGSPVSLIQDVLGVSGEGGGSDKCHISIAKEHNIKADKRTKI